MRLTKGADIHSPQGEKLGTLERVILDPDTKEVTHLVIAKGLLFKTSKVVSMDMVDHADHEHVTLLAPKDKLDELEDFEETHYVSLEQTEDPTSDELPKSYWYPPLNLAWWRAGGVDVPVTYPAAPVYVARTEQNIPEGSVALEEGSKVLSRDDKHVGNIEQVVVDSQDHRVTHFVVGEGFLFKEHKLIPSVWISRIDEHEVYLSVPSSVLERLPDYQPVK